MEHLSDPLRTPAENGIFCRISDAIARILPGACGHSRVAWPQHGRQSCLDCGASRIYRFSYDRTVSGRWVKAVR